MNISSGLRLSSCYALAQLLDMRGAAEEEEVEEMLRRVLEGRATHPDGKKVHGKKMGKPNG